MPLPTDLHVVVATGRSMAEAVRLVLPSVADQLSGLAFDLLFTERRVIGACVGGLRFGYGLAYDQTMREHQQQRQRYANLSLDQIETAEPNNFSLAFEAVTRVEFDVRSPPVTMSSITLGIGGQERRFWLLTCYHSVDEGLAGRVREVLPLILEHKAILTIR